MKTSCLVIVVALSCVCSMKTTMIRKAVVVLNNPEKGISGSVTLTHQGAEMSIVGEISGLTEGLHGFHVHELGDVTSEDCTSTGGHFNPYNENHGGPDDEERHAGDFGNIKADGNGVAKVDIIDTYVSLYGLNSILGRAIVVHAGEDDLGKGGHSDSLINGHAGARVACGVIGIAK